MVVKKAIKDLTFSEVLKRLKEEKLTVGEYNEALSMISDAIEDLYEDNGREYDNFVPDYAISEDCRGVAEVKIPITSDSNIDDILDELEKKLEACVQECQKEQASEDMKQAIDEITSIVVQYYEELAEKGLPVTLAGRLTVEFASAMSSIMVKSL